MKIYQLQNSHIIGGRENNSHIYMKNIDLNRDHRDKELHSHPDSDEYYLILTGKIVFEYESGEVHIQEGEIICFQKDELHRISKVITPAKAIIIKSTDSIREALKE